MRETFIIWLFHHTQKLYTYFKAKQAWNLTSKDLLLYPEGTFGNELGKFLKRNGFELLPKVERHDAYHLITGHGTEVKDEIALQYLCFGNGKRSIYLFGVILIGTLVLPEHINYYIKSYTIGKRCNTFHHFNYKKLLNYSLQNLREAIFSKAEIIQFQ